MSRIILSLFLLFTPLLLAGCLKEGEHTSEPSSETPPNLRITVGEETVTAVRGSYQWSYRLEDGTTANKNASAAAPPELVKEKQAINVTPGTEIGLDFGKEPDDYKVKVWDSNTNEVKESYDELVLPNSDGIVIYEILGEWDQGDVSYAFTVDVRVE